MLEDAKDTEELIRRVAALDIGKAQLVCCVRVPSPTQPGRRLQEVRTYPTMTRSLLAMADRLAGLGVSRVVMEATSDDWKAPFYLLEAEGFEVWLVNAKDVKHLPGRPKTDRLDAVWLCKGSGSTSPDRRSWHIYGQSWLSFAATTSGVSPPSRGGSRSGKHSGPRQSAGLSGW